jgi:hypothetical protein
MLNHETVTFVIPVFKLDGYRLSNFKFVLQYIAKTECAIIVVEQIKKSESEADSVLSDVVKKYKDQNITYVTYISELDIINKSAMINYAVINHVKTEYFWMNDADFYMKFNEVFSEKIICDFIQPYSAGKKLSNEESEKIKAGTRLDISYGDYVSSYISMYGALSFIAKKSSFIDIGAMDERLSGWGREDVDLSIRVSNSGEGIQQLDKKGIHLWHPIVGEPSTLNKIQSIDNLDMAILTCYFNWVGHNTSERNLNRFIDQMESDKIPLYGIELSSTDHFITTGKKNWAQVKVAEKNICFQQEACINLLETIIPDDYKKIAWIDADLHFTNNNWYLDVSNALDKYKLVQMYEREHDTDSNGNIFRTINGIVSIGGPTAENINKRFPGGAIATRRDLFTNAKLYPYSFTGTGDTILMRGMDDPVFGWGKKDIELSPRIQNLKIDVREMDFTGIYLRHEITTMQQFRTSKVIQPTVNGLKQSDLAIITCYFNWCGFTTPSRNFHRFLREMKKNDFPVFGVELSLTDKFETTGMSGWSQLKVKRENVCFQKEACLNLAEKKVPAQYTKIAWIDCDLTFLNPNWYDQASKKLECNKLIQLYTHGYNTDKYGRTVLEFPGLMYMKDRVTYHDWTKHAGYPGGAWAARRELWRHGGLYPYAPMGGGDTIFIYSMYNHNFQHSTYENIGITKETDLSIYTNWKKSVAAYIEKDISYIENKFLHEWHGDRKNRNYTHRHSVLKNINVHKQIRLNDQGILEFYNIKNDAFFSDVYNYFQGRDEDGLLTDLANFGTKRYNQIT